MEDSQTIEAIIKWYDLNNGYGIAEINEKKLLVLSVYLDETIKSLCPGDIISCIPVELNGITHATHATLRKEHKTELKKI